MTDYKKEEEQKSIILFAAFAPAAIPDWFVETVQKPITPKELFFQWRLFYAK